MSSVFPTTMTDTENQIPQAQVPLKTHKVFSKGAQVCLRVLIDTITLASFVLLITSNETFEITEIESNALKFFINAYAIVCFFTVLSWLVLIFVSRYLSVSICQFYFFVLDMIVLSLEIARCAVLTGPWYRGQCRDTDSGWFPMCHRITFSVIVSYISVVVLVLLIVTECVRNDM